MAKLKSSVYLTVVLSAPLALAACGSPIVMPGNRDASAYSHTGASAALDGNQTAVIVHGNPFAGVDTNTLLPAVTRSMQDGAGMIDTQFLPLPPQAPKPEYSVVLAFNTVGDVNPSSLCYESNIATDPNRRPIQLQAAFCGSGALTTSTGWVGEAASPTDPSFQRLVHNVTASLFPSDNEESFSSSRSSDGVGSSSTGESAGQSAANDAGTGAGGGAGANVATDDSSITGAATPTQSANSSQ